MAGFCRIMKEENNLENKEHMLDYLTQLLEDANDFSWDAAKASHAVLLCRMEQGDVKNYMQVEKSTELGELMLRDMLWVEVRIKVSDLRFRNLSSLPLACILTKVAVLTQKIMKPKVLLTNIFVLRVSMLVAGIFHILRLNVETKIGKMCQKTNE